eukprot:TRINITY_DN8275_c0_g1_i3.p1 TRINITY_DN8275_c0_g1~~TRINITY_DN8275_c0_g1_i3.p1  ORF type:complete len:211 (-),score=57.15 TRINITY_DN8275_c0_g1_i3:227-859(-)
MNFKVSVLSCVLAISNLAYGQSGMTCNQCKQVAYTVGTLAVSPEGLKSGTDYIKESVCAALPADFQCETNLEWFWQAIASGMFSPKDGWYSPQYFCEDECSPNSLESRNEVNTGPVIGPVSGNTPSCSACSEYLYTSNAYMADEELLDEIVEEFRKGNFCKFVKPYLPTPNEDRCNQNLDTVIKTAMPLIAESGDKWVDQVCRENVRCQA